MRAHHLFAELVQQLEAATVFFGHGAASAEEEALLLLSHVMKRDPESLNQDPQRVLEAGQVQRARALLRERIQRRVPMSYVTGTAWFAGLEFIADERALVPRSPFAELIGQGFQPWLGAIQPAGLLDLCTGGGCIADSTRGPAGFMHRRRLHRHRHGQSVSRRLCGCGGPVA